MQVSSLHYACIQTHIKDLFFVFDKFLAYKKHKALVVYVEYECKK